MRSGHFKSIKTRLDVGPATIIIVPPSFMSTSVTNFPVRGGSVDQDADDLAPVPRCRDGETAASRSHQCVAPDAGGQLDLRLVALPELEMTLSIGEAVACERGWAPRREATVSLKVLPS
jgi:hypothetical protein